MAGAREPSAPVQAEDRLYEAPVRSLSEVVRGFDVSELAALAPEHGVVGKDVQPGHEIGRRDRANCRRGSVMARVRRRGGCRRGSRGGAAGRERAGEQWQERQTRHDGVSKMNVNDDEV